MVTRSVILVTPSEAAAFAATATSSSPAAAAAADSIISNAPSEQINLDEELQTNSFHSISCTKPAQHPSPGGLVQLCRHEGCFHAVDFERRGGGLCCVHQKNQKEPMNGEQSDSEDSADDAKNRGVAADEYCLDDEVGKKRGRPLEDSISNNKTKKRQRVDAFVVDLTGVPPQPPIPKSAGRIKEGASKYMGVSFDKAMNKWVAKIRIDGKQRHIGTYENEEAAAVDYACAVLKYKGQGALVKARERSSIIIDLSDVPPQPPVPKSSGPIKEGASKYTGVYFNKPTNNWRAQIMIDGKNRHIGSYENEEAAAADCARAVVKYKKQETLGKAGEQDSIIIDLSDVPPQPPIPKIVGRVREGASKYTGVSFNNQRNKWHSQIRIAGKSRYIGSYENEEEAAADYARAVFKYKGQGALDKARKRKALGKAREQDSIIIDLSDVPPQSPIPKSSGSIKEGASKYVGVTFNKSKNKWTAQITIEGKQRAIGSYDNEEAAAVDYARAVLKYKGQGALDKAREQDSFIDLSDVPPQPPIPKIEGAIIDGASKYTGVSFCKPMKKWHAQIMIDGKNRTIGYYENEEEAGADYARTLFKYKGQGALENAREQDSFTFDLTDVPPQPPVPKSLGHIKEGASQFTGVSFDKRRNKWKAQISIDGKSRTIGYYENEEAAATDYARAFVKYKGRWALDKAREQDSFSIDLSDVPPQPQPPIPKSDVG